MQRLSRGTLICALLASLALPMSGCGGDDEEGEEAGPKPVAARESAKDALRRVVLALGGRDCDRLYSEVVHSSLPPPPRQPFCQGLGGALTGLAEDDPVKRYGTAVVADYETTRGERQSLVMALDQDGRYKFVIADELADARQWPTTQTPPADAAKFDALAAGFVRAARGRNCRELFASVHPSLGLSAAIQAPPPPGQTRQQAVCDAIAGGPFQKALVRDSDAKPKRLGVSSRYAFYGLTVQPDRHYTIVFALADPRPAPGNSYAIPLTGSRYRWIDLLYTAKPSLGAEKARIEGTIVTYYDSSARGDGPTYCETVTTRFVRSQGTERCNPTRFKPRRGLPTGADVKVPSIRVRGSRATAKVSVRGSSPLTLQLVKRDLQWRIDADVTER